MAMRMQSRYQIVMMALDELFGCVLSLEFR